MKTKDWKPEKESMALLIGHDPRLKASDTIAEFSLFANYYFESNSKDRTFKRKYGLAASAFDQIKYIFPMSQQVNYWLQILGLYDSENSFKEFSAPKPVGVENSSPYYEATKQRAFLMICGN